MIIVKLETWGGMPIDAFIEKPQALRGHSRAFQAVGDVEIERRIYSVDIELIDMDSEPSAVVMEDLERPTAAMEDPGGT